MATITITLEDKIDGNVKVTANPPFETMAMKVDSGEMPTAAETYALMVLRKIRETSKKLDRFDHKLTV